jgi:hypothetical protein
MPAGPGQININPGTGLTLDAYDLTGSGLWVPTSMLRNTAGLISSSNPVDVAVRDASGNLLGGAASKPVLIRQSDGTSAYDGAKESGGNLATLAGAVSGGRVVITFNASALLTSSKLMGSSATSGWLVKSGAGRLYNYEVTVNVSTGTVFVFACDRATSPAASDDPKADAFAAIATAIVTNNSGTQRSIPPTGRKFSNGLVIIVSSSISSQTFTASDTVRVTVDYE